MADTKPKPEDTPPADAPPADAPTVAEDLSPITAEMRDQIAAQRKEYGTFVANRQIHVGTALAYNPGDPVPVSNVQRFGYDRVPVDGGGFESWVDKVG